MNKIELYNEDNVKTFERLKDESVDIILTDPPYLYLKGQKLDRPFNEKQFFENCKRVLTKEGFIVLFGRGTSFYRWNTILDQLGFVFKEEIVWDKKRRTSPALPLGRIHETISIHTKEKGFINRTYITYLESKRDQLERIINDLNRIESSLKSHNVFKHIKDGLNNKYIYNICGTQYKNNSVTFTGYKTRKDVGVFTFKTMYDNCCCENDIMLDFGIKYKSIHPTQKPVRLLERLLALVVPKNKDNSEILVFDPFGGSFSTMAACLNMNLKGISAEIDQEYFDKGFQRIKNLQTPSLFS